jgi:hypothetical protein
MERTSEMLRTGNTAKVKQFKPQMRTIAFTALWLVLLGAAVAFIAFAGRV